MAHWTHDTFYFGKISGERRDPAYWHSILKNIIIEAPPESGYVWAFHSLSTHYGFVKLEGSGKFIDCPLNKDAFNTLLKDVVVHFHFDGFDTVYCTITMASQIVFSSENSSEPKYLKDDEPEESSICKAQHTRYFGNTSEEKQYFTELWSFVDAEYEKRRMLTIPEWLAAHKAKKGNSK